MKNFFLLSVFLIMFLNANAHCRTNPPRAASIAINSWPPRVMHSYIDTAVKKSNQQDLYQMIVGNKMPSFTSPDIKGNKVDLKKLKGKIVVLDFWFIGCPPCRYLIPELDKITDEYKVNKDIVFIAISNDKAEALREFLKKEIFKYQMIGDGQWLFDYYKIESCPLSLVIDKEGTIVFSSKGFGVATLPDRIREALEKIK